MLVLHDHEEVYLMLQKSHTQLRLKISSMNLEINKCLHNVASCGGSDGLRINVAAIRIRSDVDCPTVCSEIDERSHEGVTSVDAKFQAIEIPPHDVACIDLDTSLPRENARELPPVLNQGDVYEFAALIGDVEGGDHAVVGSTRGSECTACDEEKGKQKSHRGLLG